MASFSLGLVHNISRDREYDCSNPQQPCLGPSSCTITVLGISINIICYRSTRPTSGEEILTLLIFAKTISSLSHVLSLINDQSNKCKTSSPHF